MSNLKRKWESYKEKESNKRLGRKNNTDSREDEYITVQRLTANVEGRCQKYGRIGPLTIVPMKGKECTMENIKQACKNHFNIELECDILAGERGPSYTDLSQIKSYKVIHIRFMECAADVIEVKRVEKPRSNPSPKPASPLKTQPKKTDTVAASVPVSKMLKIGQLIAPKVEIVSLYLEEFSIMEREWSKPFIVKLALDKSPFSIGGFRSAFMAKTIKGLPEEQYVLKRYKDEEASAIEKLSGSLEANTRKAVQMNALARNFAQNMQLESPLEFGKSFTYTKVYFSTLHGQYVTLENYLEGDPFEKYINNDGYVCGDDVGVISLKAETFSHYTYERSDKQLMVLDIQGIGYNLCDPEIASSRLREGDDKSPILFCTGNLSETAINNFLTGHSCNKFCRLLQLPEM